MNPITSFFDEKFITALFQKKILPKYKDFKEIKKVKIKAHKNHIWDKTYHVVLEFDTFFIDRENKIKKIPIFCSAHSCEPRKNLYLSLKHLWNNGFNKGYLTSPRPLFYFNQFKAVFYRGIKGKIFYQYIRDNNQWEIENLIPKISDWFVKLHKMSTKGLKNFNRKNSRIKTTIPGRDKILNSIKLSHPDCFDFFSEAYGIFIKKEEDFLKSTIKRWLVHGDAHPENVIKMGRKKVAFIDFNDLCLSDFARDLGCFLQQFEYMAMRKIGDAVFVERMKELFLKTYLEKSKTKMSEDLMDRIDNYYNWTAIRTATFFLLKNNPELERAEFLINKVKSNLIKK